MPYSTKSISQTTSDGHYLNFIQKSVSIGIWEYDLNPSILHWDIETKKIHEVDKDFVPNVDTAINFYKAGYSRDTITKLFNECIVKLKEYDVELQITTPKGLTKWVRAIGKPIVENGELIKVIGLFQDIDEKTRLSKNLADKESLLRKSFEYAVIGKATTDLKGNWLTVNKSLCKTFGYSEKELRQFSFRDLTHPDDINIGAKSIKAMLEGKKDNLKTEKRYINKKGETIWALLSTSIVRDNNNVPQFFITQINDLTLIKKASREIEKLLITTGNQNKRLLNFAHIVSHNLRSHSGNLKMLLDIIKTDMPEILDNEAFELLDHAVNQLQETVENLNEVATINVKNHIETEPQNLLKSFENVFAIINAQIKESDAEIKLDIDSKIYVSAIPAYLDSILLNVLTNAIKYRRPNANLKINLKATIKKSYVVIKVKDNGVGIDLNKHGAKLFGMYKTFHQHKDARGIGLFITKNQIESMGGKIEVKSKVNIGTTFYIYLKHHEAN